jgi:hypothetical protein
MLVPILVVTRSVATLVPSAAEGWQSRSRVVMLEAMMDGRSIRGGGISPFGERGIKGDYLRVNPGDSPICFQALLLYSLKHQYR